MNFDWGYVVTGVVTLALGLVKYFTGKKKTDQGESDIAILKNKIAINTELHTLSNEINCPRVLLLYVNDGTGFADVGKPLEINIYDEAIDSNMESHLHLIDATITDYRYNVMLRELHNDNDQFIITSEMEDSLLRSFYLQMNIVCSYVFKVGQVGDSFYYMSVAFTELVKFDNKIKLYSQLSSNKIFKKLKNNEDV